MIRRPAQRVAGWRPAAAALAATLLAGLMLACGSAERRLEAATALRRGGDSKGALEAYKTLLADLGEGALPADQAAVRAKALRSAGDIAYLELGDYTGALSYYRRIVSLQPGGREALEARGVIGDIYRDRFNDPLAAIAQYANVAAAPSPLAPSYQLEVAKGYLALARWEQARTEARILRDRWPTHELADEAQLIAGQAWALEGRVAEALGAFQALIDRKPRPEIAARALEAQAHLHAEKGRFDRAVELYGLALPAHPNPDAVRTHIAAVRDRQKRASTATPGDRAAAFDEARAVRRALTEEP